MTSIIKYNISYRNGVFETNSSSMHSITMYGPKGIDSPTINSDNIVEIPFGEFDWGYEKYNDADTKLSYLATLLAAICIRNRNMNSIEEIMETDDFEQIKSVIMENTNCSDVILTGEIEQRIYSDGECYSYMKDGYIDHQSYERYDTLEDFLNNYNVDCYDFIFNEQYTLVISNDNC